MLPPLALLLGSLVFAAPARAFKDLWRGAIKTVLADGNLPDLPNPAMVPYKLEDLTGDPKAAHRYRIISTVGRFPHSGEYELNGLRLFFGEQRASKAGGWLRDEWAFEADKAGSLVEVRRDSKTVGLADPKTKAKFAEELRYWADRKP